MAIKRWNTRAASQADTARQEGVSLGLAMAAQKARLQRHNLNALTSMPPQSAAAWAIEKAILALAPIPPHVAAARVLLDMPTNKDGLHVLPDHMRAALEQIAKDAAHA